MKSNSPFQIRFFVIIILVFIILGYSYYSFRHIIEGPTIKVFSPSNGFVSSSTLFVIEGTTANTSLFTINNSPVLVDEKGNFSEKLLLYPGYNIIVLFAKDRFGRENKLTLEGVYNPPPSEKWRFEIINNNMTDTGTSSATGTQNVPLN